ncbi:MAG: glycoside hydrolase family 3 N-terminal domain-containing protein [Bacteroidota bacterium]
MQQIEALLSSMTLREKAGQMTQVTLDTLCVGKPYKVQEPLQIDPQKLERLIRDEMVGSVLNVATHAHHSERWREIIQQIQDTAAQTRLGIPVLYGIDSIHGASYVRGSSLFPQQLGLATAANPEMVETLFRLAAEETVQAGIPWLFAPVADVCRNPLWPRAWEGYGEDPYLAGLLTAAATRGIEQVDKAASCLKHYLAYGAAYTGKDRTPAYLHERQVREYHLPPFLQGLKAGAQTIMINSSELNGIPLHADPYWLDTVLRKELGFEGLLVTDWQDILYLYEYHRVADSYRAAVKLAIQAGIDMSMTPIDTEFAEHVVDLVESGELSEERIDQSVRRILTLKQELSLFEQPVVGQPGRPDRVASLGLIRESAAQAIVLLRNEQELLPLDKDQQLLVCGPAANSLRPLHGGWTYTWQGERTDELAPEDEPTVLEAIQQEFGQEQVRYFLGCEFEGRLDLKGLTTMANQADTIILCLGEDSYTEFYGSIDDLYLPAVQEELAEACIATGKKVILLLLQGRPRLISRFEAGIPAIATAFYPGQGGGWAIAKLLSGAINPSGRLPLTYPRYPNSLMTYDHKTTENRELQGIPAAFKPQFEFGHGLSYSEVKYEDLEVENRSVNSHLSINVKVRLTNSSARSTDHIVQLYLRDHYASITPPEKRLRASKRIHLAAKESQEVHFELGRESLEFIGIDCQPVVESGTFSVMVGDLTAEFEI